MRMSRWVVSRFGINRVRERWGGEEDALSKSSCHAASSSGRGGPVKGLLWSFARNGRRWKAMAELCARAVEGNSLA